MVNLELIDGRGDEKRWTEGEILAVKSIVFDDGLNLEGKEGRLSKMTPKFLPCKTQRVDDR